MGQLFVVEVDSGEVSDLLALAGEPLAQRPEIAAGAHPFDRTDMHDALTARADRVPKRIRDAIATFSAGQAGAFLLLRGILPGGVALGPTPAHWIDKVADPGTQTIEAAQFVLAGLLGKPFGIATCQAGHMVQEVAPISGYETALFGNSSEVDLFWHTEDAFLDAPARYLHLCCIRNQERVATRLSAPALDELPVDVLATLGEARFELLPDISHMIVPRDTDTASDQERMAQANLRPQLSPLVSGAPGHRKLLYDKPYLGDLGHDPEAAAAFAILEAAIDDAAFEHIMCPGDFLFIDNHRAAHARGRFKARYDGTDRWLKRIYIAEPDFVPRVLPELLVRPSTM